ncbi:MAG: hypothetical protein ACRDI2_10055 [Chloroflexota bacterium]
MRLVAVPDVPKLHTTPLAAVRVERSRVRVDLDDEEEQRLRLTFGPFQAVRVTTADCFLAPRGLRSVRQRVVEVVDSPWVEELRAAQRQIDHTATFMDRARHFLIPAPDGVIEVVAWGVQWEGPGGSGHYPPEAAEPAG